MGMGMGLNPYPPVYVGDPVGLFLYRGYGYEVVIPGGYLPIAISTEHVFFLSPKKYVSFVMILVRLELDYKYVKQTLLFLSS